MHTARLYNTLIQHVKHALIQHKVHTTHSYNTLIQHANRKVNSSQKSGGGEFNKDNTVILVTQKS